MPHHVDRHSLALALRCHPDLRCPGPDHLIPEEGDGNGNGVIVHTLALDVRSVLQVATVRFQTLPLHLSVLGHREQLTIEIKITPENMPVEVDGVWDPIFDIKVTIDEHYDGITTLISPPTDEEHEIDVLAISGLGSHPFGSFVHKDDGNMWLTDNLPQDIPTARIMIYGYESGLQHSTSLVQLDDLASSLQNAISQLLRSRKRKPLVLIGHSLGGLLVKEALIRFDESDYDSNLLEMIRGILLFGAPNDGMNIESLTPLVNDQPNRFLLESLSSQHSYISKTQKSKFSKALKRTNCQLFCFYETQLSPTAAQVDITLTGCCRCGFTKAFIAGSSNRTIQDERHPAMSRNSIFCDGDELSA